LNSSGDQAIALLSSLDGIIWSPISTTITNFTILTIVWNGIYWLMGGSGSTGLLMNTNYNPTGTWTTITLPASGDVVQLVWNKVMWVGAVQRSSSPFGYLMYSYDGITWTQAQTSLQFFISGSPENPKPTALSWNTNYWIAAGNNNIILYSYDGIIWYSLPSGQSLIGTCIQLATSFKPLISIDSSQLTVSYKAGNQPYSNITGSLLDLNTTPSRVYTTGSVVSSVTSRFIIMLNVTFTMPVTYIPPVGDEGGQPELENIGLKITVGRYTTSTPTSGEAINVVTNTSVSSSFPSATMIAWPAMGASAGSQINISGSAVDSPGSSNNFYYSVWAHTTSSITLTNMSVFLSVLQVSA
jgi:hypothetical protein